MVTSTAKDTVRLVGYIDFATTHLLEAALDVLLPAAQGTRLDMRQVSFVDVAGTRALLRAADRLRHGHRLVLVDPPQMLSRVLPFFPSSKERIQVVRR